MFDASLAHATAGAARTIVIRNAVAASTRPTRPVKACATEVSRADNPSMFSLLVSPLDGNEVFGSPARSYKKTSLSSINAPSSLWVSLCRGKGSHDDPTDDIGARGFRACSPVGLECLRRRRKATDQAQQARPSGRPRRRG